MNEFSTSSSSIAPLCRILSEKGSVVLIPTETVYGLGCDATDPVATGKIYDLKKRADNKPLAIFVRHVRMLDGMGIRLPKAAEKIADAFCPGPITLVVPDGRGSTFGFRIPDHPFVLELLEQYGRPLAVTSANLSGEPAALSVKEALASIQGEPDAVVDGGALPADSKASTVIMVFEDSSFKILRPGPVTEDDIRKALAGL